MENQNLSSNKNLNSSSDYYFNTIKSLNKSNDKLLSLYSDLPSNISNKNDIIHWKEKKESLEKILVDCNSIKDFPKEFLSLHFFNNFLSCHLLIHEKGSSNCFCYNYRQKNAFSKTNITIGHFNKFYNIVKKSKNKSFSRELIKNINIELVGTFLAKEFSLGKHNLILVLSRNDFLGPSREEQYYFSSFSKNLGPILDGLLQNETTNLKLISIIQCLYEYPFPLAILKKKEIIFKNLIYKEVPSTEDLLVVEEFNFEEKYSLILYKNKDEEVHTSDLFHFERISLLGELLNTLRHELSNPLFGLGLASQLLSHEFADSDNEELFTEVHKNITRCQLIIENFSNLYQNANTDKEVSLKKLIEEAFTLAKSEMREIEKCIEYSSEVSDNLQIKLNPTWFVQVLFNLLINSAQALRSHTDNKNKIITLNCSIKSKVIHISVKDNGPGIEEEKISQLFKPFFTTKKSGTGLGLPISKNLAKKMGGDLVVINNIGSSGLTFNFTIPMDNHEHTHY